jgi:hypothetical protein
VRSELIGPNSAPVAIAVDLLRERRLFAFDAGGYGYIVVTSPNRANRMHERGAYGFVAAGTPQGAP